MFFILSKLFWALISPSALIALTLIAGCATVWRWRRLGRFLLGVSCALTIVFALLPTGQNLLYALESRYARPNPLPAHVDGIVVLGGAADINATDISGQPEFDEQVDRVHAAMALSRTYPQAKIIYTGGSGLVHKTGHNEADVMRLFFKSIGYDTRHVVYEEQSRNTYENFINTRALVRPEPGQTWLLVTSAWHMPRSMAIARKQGWGDIIPYPVDYQSMGRYVWIPPYLDVLENLYTSQLAVKELLGYAAYKLTGKL